MATWEPNKELGSGLQERSPTDYSYFLRGIIRGVSGPGPPYNQPLIEFDAFRDPAVPQPGAVLDPSLPNTVLVRRARERINLQPGSNNLWDVWVVLEYRNALVGGFQQLPPASPLNDPENNLRVSSRRESFETTVDGDGQKLEVTYKGRTYRTIGRRNRAFGELVLPKVLSTTPEIYLNQVDTLNADVWRGYQPLTVKQDGFDSFSIDGGATWNAEFYFLTTTDPNVWNHVLWVPNEYGQPVAGAVEGDGEKTVRMLKTSFFASLPV